MECHFFPSFFLIPVFFLNSRPSPSRFERAPSLAVFRFERKTGKRRKTGRARTDRLKDGPSLMPTNSKTFAQCRVFCFEDSSGSLNFMYTSIITFNIYTAHGIVLLYHPLYMHRYVTLLCATVMQRLNSRTHVTDTYPVHLNKCRSCSCKNISGDIVNHPTSGIALRYVDITNG